MNDDKWRHFAIVIDDDGTPAFDEIKIYIDGQLKKNTYPNSNNIINVNLDGTVFIGAHESDTEQFNRFFKGQLDDIRIYDYPIGGERIAELYFAGIDDGRICLEEHSPLSYDYNNNCMVEIDDLLVFSALWLNVNFWDDFSGLYNQWLADSAFKCGGIIYRQTGYNGDVQQLTYLNSISDLHGAENCWARLESTNGIFLENRSDCFNNQIGDRTLCINENAGSAYYNTGIEMSDFVGAEINLSVFAGQRWADSVIGTYQINSLTTNGTLQTLATETYTTSYSGKLEQSTELRYIVAPQDQGKLVVRLTQEEPNSGRVHFDGIRLGWCINRPIY